MKERFNERLPLIRPLLVPAIFYIGLLAMAMTFLDASPNSPWRLPVLLAPMVPGLFFALGIIKVIGKLDEMNRKIMIQSSTAAFAVTLFLTISLGLLELGNLVHLNSIYISLFMVVAWLVAKLLISRRSDG
jgi:hypothetical protein